MRALWGGFHRGAIVHAGGAFSGGGRIRRMESTTASNASRSIACQSWRPVLRFSLRALLIALTAICIWLGVKVNHARNNRQAIDAARSMGAFIEYAHQFPKGYGKPGSRRDGNAQPPGPAWLRNLVGDEYFVSVVGLQFLKETPADDDLAKLSPLTDLRFLSFQSRSPERLTGSGLSHLRAMQKLRTLDFNGQHITDDALRHLRPLQQLNFVSLHNTKVTDAGMVHLKELKNLTAVSVSSTAVSDLGLLRLKDVPKLSNIIARNTTITDAGVEQLKAISPHCKVDRE